MMELGYIKEDIQNIAYAIESVLNIDVTIVNSNLVRIAGTGIYLDKIGERVNEYSAFKKSYTEQSIIFIDDPQSSEICKECYGNKNCMEFAEVCCPIVYEDKSYGVIGLIAFTEKQAQIIKGKENDLINFLGKMADLISSKLKAHIKTYELDLEKKKLETLFDNMDKAVVSIDVNGKIDKYNSKFIQIFNLKNEMTGKNIFRELEFINKPSIDNFKKNKSCSFFYRRNGHDSKGIYNMNKIELQGALKGYVIDFIDKKDAIKNYNKMNKDYRIKLDNIIGSSSAIMKSKKEASMASKSTSTVLITGESGTGKELFARAIHNHSDRVDNPFITINCAAIPDNLLESELFGYEEGAFTGAKKSGLKGKFEIANGGTILLDEIGDLPLSMQVKLLRVLQEREIMRVGGSEVININVRVIAATNKSLQELIDQGKFREDLYYRLNVIHLNLPPLRERIEDIDLLADNLRVKLCNKYGIYSEGISKEALEHLKNYDWPGNVRQLENVIERAINLLDTELLISSKHLPEKIIKTKSKKYNMDTNGLKDVVDEMEKEIIVSTLEKTKGNKNEAAKILGLSRAGLYKKIKRLGLE